MTAQRSILIVAIVLAVGYGWLRGAFVGFAAGADSPQEQTTTTSGEQETAIFAAGCFWCAESDFEKVPGVTSVVSGYTGGRVPSPTYEQVSSGGTGHAEAVEVRFDPRRVTYDALLDHFWHNVDPFVANRQFCDVGEQYRAEIFVHGAAQREAAERSRREIQRKFTSPLLVDIAEAGPFYRAEAYHQDFYKHHSVQYRYYRWRCGRDARLAEIWHKPT